jgi:hypothetical protein
MNVFGRHRPVVLHARGVRPAARGLLPAPIDDDDIQGYKRGRGVAGVGPLNQQAQP